MASSRYSYSSSSGRSHSSSSSSGSHESIRTTKVPLPRKSRAVGCVVWFAGAQPGLVNHLRREDVTHFTEPGSSRPARRSSSSYAKPRTTSRWHFVKHNSNDIDSDIDDGYQRRRTNSSSAGGAGRPMDYRGTARGPRKTRRPDGASEFGGPPPWVGGDDGYPDGPDEPGMFGSRGPMPGGPGPIPGRQGPMPGRPMPPRMPNGMPVPPRGAPGAGGGFRGPVPGAPGGPAAGMRPGNPGASARGPPPGAPPVIVTV